MTTDSLQKSYSVTIRVSFVSYVVQAIVNNFFPLLFLTFQNKYGVSLSVISLLIGFNFCMQLTVDLLSAFLLDRIGYRAGLILAHAAATLGVAGMAFLPDITPDPVVGLFLAVGLSALGGGLLEVIVSPLVEACPTPHKEKTMSLLHSFYAWGHAGVVLIATGLFALFGVGKYRIAALLFACVPLVNGLFFCRVPMPPIATEKNTEDGVLSLKELFSTGTFYFLLLLMIGAGAAEITVAQWISTFAEKELGLAKEVGDLLGPTVFALCMAAARTFYGRHGKLALSRLLLLCAGLCTAGYLMTALCHSAAGALTGCALCGLSCGCFWPGTYSTAAKKLPRGGTTMFALLAFAGDVGCSLGPAAAGIFSDAFGGDLRLGILLCTLFPLMLFLLLLADALKTRRAKAGQTSSAHLDTEENEK